MDVKMEDSWKTVLATELQKDYFKYLFEKVEKAYLENVIFPPQQQIFNAFEHCRFNDVKVVILGQDPYINDGEAQGLSFSVPDGIKIPPSLLNIYKEIKDDLNIEMPESGNLERWANQGVLLLNATLTVEAGKSNSHQGWGWEQFTDEVIHNISSEKDNVVFLLWGNYARGKSDLIDHNKHLVLEAPHPSPLAAYRGFFGCKHFSKTNEYLEKNNQAPIEWRLL